MPQKQEAGEGKVEPRVSRITERYLEKQLAQFAKTIKQEPWAKDMDLVGAVRRNVAHAEDKHESIYKRHAKSRKISLEKYKKQLQARIEKIVQDAHFFKRVGDVGLNDILNGSGQFKSKRETGGSSSSSGKEGASTHEKRYGIPQSADRSTWPHYGYLSSDGNGLIDEGKADMDGYGKITIKFNKKKILTRTTITFDDSWNDSNLVSTPAAHPHFTSAFPGPFTYGKQSTISEFDPLNLPDSGNPPIDEVGRHHYYEAQYHGGIGRDDIESIHIRKSDWDNDAKLRATIETFQKNNPKSKIKIIIY